MHFHFDKIIASSSKRYISIIQEFRTQAKVGVTKLQIPNPKRWAKHLQTKYKDFFFHSLFLSF
jgi:hypothetical protein